MKRLVMGFILTGCLGINGCGGPTEKTAPASTPAPAPAAKPPDEAAAVKILGQVNQAQADYLKRNRRFALTYEELIDAHLLTAEPSKDATGYEFTLRPAADAESYILVANPVSAAQSGLHFFTDKSGMIHFETGKDATAASPRFRSTEP